MQLQVLCSFVLLRRIQKALLCKTWVAPWDRTALLQPWLEARKCDNMHKFTWLSFGTESVLRNSCYFSTETSSLKPWLVFAALSTADGAFALVESQLLKYNVEGFSPCKACLYKARLSVDVPLKEYQVFWYRCQMRDLSGKYQEKPCLSSWEKTGEGTQEISVLCVLPRDCKVKGRHISVQFQVPDCIFSIGFCSRNMQNSCVIPPKSAFSNKYRYVSTHFFSVMERWTEEKNEVRKFHTGYIQEQKTMRLLIKK